MIRKKVLRGLLLLQISQATILDSKYLNKFLHLLWLFSIIVLNINQTEKNE